MFIQVKASSDYIMSVVAGVLKGAGSRGAKKEGRHLMSHDFCKRLLGAATKLTRQVQYRILSIFQDDPIEPIKNESHIVC